MEFWINETAVIALSSAFALVGLARAYVALKKK